VPPYDALCSAAREHLGTLGQSDGIARVTLALAADFDAENRTNCTTDVTALSRLADAYMKACVELARTPQTEMNLPFLTANETGPKHFQLTVTPAVFAALASREPAKAAEAPRAEAGEEPPKKKGWWPFG
jgi:molecular chaperone DnaK